jgi:hypothetical protein
MSALKFLAVLLKTKFPDLSAFLAFTRAKSPKIDSSSKYFLPLKTAVALGLLKIYTYEEPFLYFIGKPPSSRTVPTPVAV